MKPKRLFTTLALLMLWVNALHAQLDKGIITGNFTIRFTDPNVTIKPKEEFSLSGLGLQKSLLRFWFEEGRMSEYTPPELDPGQKSKFGNSFWKKYKHYVVTIHNNNNGKDYEAVILFAECPKKQSKEPVCQSYEIKIDDALFEEANGGKIASSYEYYNLGAASEHMIVPTWLIFFKGK